ncbi:hypothetical protein GJ496_007160 [Pomphorhynchus laevis]|nr:hypothetical protein GJ496_007160 [Pomphorhynchus laevis]
MLTESGEVGIVILLGPVLSVVHPRIVFERRTSPTEDNTSLDVECARLFGGRFERSLVDASVVNVFAQSIILLPTNASQ